MRHAYYPVAAVIIPSIAMWWISNAPLARATVIFADNFEDRNSWELLYGERPPKVCAPTNARYLPVDFTSPYGNRSGLHMYFPRSAYDTTNPGRRVEIKQHAYNWTAYQQERWYAFSIYLPADYPTNVAYHILMQFQGTSDRDEHGVNYPGEEARSPAFMLGIETNGTWGGQIRYSANAIDHGNSTTTPQTIPWINGGYMKGPAVRRGEWTHWVLNAVWDWRAGGLGRFRGWVADSDYPDGQLMFDYTGPTGFNDANPPYTKLGIYYSQSSLAGWPPDVPALEVYYDRFIVGDSGESLATMRYAPLSQALDYADWSAMYFNAAEQANPAIGGLGADPDRDALPNLLEFALGLSPQKSSRMQQEVSVEPDENEQPYLTLRYRRSRLASGVVWRVQCANSLAGPWTADTEPSGPVMVGAPADEGDGTETATFRDSVPVTAATCRFLRIQVLEP